MGYSRLSCLTFVATLAIAVTWYTQGAEALALPPSATWNGNWGNQDRSMLEGNLRNEV